MNYSATVCADSRPKNSSPWLHASASEMILVTYCDGNQVVCAPFGGSPLRGSLSRDRRAGRTARSAGDASRPGAGLFGRHRYRARRDAADRGREQSSEVEERGLLRQSLCGVSPIEASSGKVVRHRLNLIYIGNRDANRALYMICLVRMGRDRRTREYVARRTAEGKSKREIIRCLKRYVAREVYRVLVSGAPSPLPMGS
jgi:hypothetical protein